MRIMKFHILITTYYAVGMKDVDVLKKICWKALILDDAHRLENPKTRLFEERASLSRDPCILLTCTPLQKLGEELWALLYIADPITFKSREKHISDKFGDIPDAKQISDLHTVLKSYLCLTSTDWAANATVFQQRKTLLH
jgi:SNF2 family DNA or RNA helicase